MYAVPQTAIVETQEDIHPLEDLRPARVGIPHEKMSMTYMIMMIPRTFTTIMKMNSTALRMRKITGMKLNK